MYPPNNIDQTNDIMDTCFGTAAYASKVAIHCTLNMSPGVLVFQRDTILNIPLITDLLLLHERQQIIIDERLQRANLRRRTFDYQPGDQILILTNNPTTLQDRGIGPYTNITHVQTNGTITFQRTPHIREFWAKGNPLTFPLTFHLVLREKLREIPSQILFGLREISQTETVFPWADSPGNDKHTSKNKIPQK